jgi:serine/threonine protein kinase
VPAPTTADEFLALYRRSGLFDPAAFADRAGDRLPADPGECAARLVSAGLLTRYQAERLLAGRYKGFVLGPYVIQRPLGGGGMGKVFLADHPKLDRRVAVKVLPDRTARDRLTLERFLREARAAAALDHPNVVKVFDTGHAAGVHFLVMEYVEGIDLQRLVDRDGPLPVPRAVGYALQAGYGLQHAHERGIVHRDVKPGNLIATAEGTVKVLDMGLARSLTADRDRLTSQLGKAADVAWTVDYASPEQALNRPVDARTDVYSLGATLFALLAGRPPFVGTPAQKMVQHQKGPPPDLAKAGGGRVPGGLCRVVAKLMATKPDDRYPTAAAAVEALAPWQRPGGGAGRIVTALRRLFGR